ncbi:P protein-like isoform X2 [Cydia pomonella]|uniref:P protein-like isoform X2 n=1 Tax=Cydia pomonella TaxID=82600 RepID=UPI002ADDC33F|nr:P protein-like isoform X2 [Cydia pomonella]
MPDDLSSSVSGSWRGLKLVTVTGSSCDGDVSTLEGERDLTPGSLEVWVDLPDTIKYDPSLAPFKHLYEQHHGKLDSTENHDGDKSIFTKNPTEISKSKENVANNDVPTKGCDRLVEPIQTQEAKKVRSARKKQVDRTLKIIKLSILVAGWVFLTVSLLLNSERTDVVLHTAVKEGEVKVYPLNCTLRRVTLKATLTGPFDQTAGNDTDNILQVWLERTFENYTEEHFEKFQSSLPWSVRLRSDDVIDFAESATDTKTLVLVGRLNVSDSENDVFNRNGSELSLRMQSSSNATVPLTVSYVMSPLEERDGLIYSTILLCTLYILVIFEVVNRTIAALLSSSLSVGVLALTGSRPSLPELVSWLDVETLLLLLSMMLLVAILAETGLLDYLALMAFEVTGGRTWPLINCLCLFTAVFSTFLDNVTTVLLMTPVTIRLCEVMQLNPVPVLMSMVIFSNVGGAATPVGDPPNVIIASHPAVLRENINFTTFTLHMGVGILLVCVQTYLQLRYMFRDLNKLRHDVPREIQEMRQEIAVWKRAAGSLSLYSRDEDIVRKALEKKVERLNAALLKREAGGGVNKTDPKFCSTLAQMKQKYRIRDKPLLVKSCVCVSFVVIVFFLHAFPFLQRLSLGWTALLGALLLLLLADIQDLEPILARVEWSTLLFFAALFVLMEALSKLGLIDWIGKLTGSLILQVGEESRLTVAIMLILWVSGLASAFVDNIPLTTMMVRVIAGLADPAGLALPLAPLAWALSFGACLGGNGTLIGASANVVCAGVAEQHGYRFTFLQYLRVGFPVMLGNLLIATGYLLLCNAVGWH